MFVKVKVLFSTFGKKLINRRKQATVVLTRSILMGSCQRPLKEKVPSIEINNQIKFLKKKWTLGKANLHNLTAMIYRLAF